MLEITGILRSPSEAWNHKFNLIGVSLTKPVRGIGGIKVGDKVLVHAGASGPGSMLNQVAKGLGAEVVTTIRNDWQRAASVLG